MPLFPGVLRLESTAPFWKQLTSVDSKGSSHTQSQACSPHLTGCLGFSILPSFFFLPFPLFFSPLCLHFPFLSVGKVQSNS